MKLTLKLVVHTTEHEYMALLKSMQVDGYLSLSSHLCSLSYSMAMRHEHQLWIYGHMACFPDVDPVSKIGSVQDNYVWRPRECQHNPRLGQ